jgi:hypothetical protein
MKQRRIQFFNKETMSGLTHTNVLHSSNGSCFQFGELSEGISARGAASLKHFIAFLAPQAI